MSRSTVDIKEVDDEVKEKADDKAERDDDEVNESVIQKKESVEDGDDDSNNSDGVGDSSDVGRISDTGDNGRMTTRSDADRNGGERSTQELRREEERPASTRAEVLKKRLVVAYRRKQAEKQIAPELKPKAPGKGAKVMGKLGKIAATTDYVMDMANMAITVGSTGISEANGIYTMKQKERDENFKGDSVTDGLNIASGVADSVTLAKNTTSLFTKTTKGVLAGIGAAKTKSKRKRRTGWLNAASSAMGAGAAATGMAKNIMGIGKSFAGWKLQGANGGATTLGKWSSGLGAASAGLGLLGAIGGLGSGIWEKKMFKETAAKAGGFAGKAEDSTALEEARQSIRELKERQVDDGDAEGKAALAEEMAAQKQKRHNAKAHLYAMKQAKEFNKMKSAQSVKGVGGLVSAVMGAGAAAGGYAFGSSPFWKLIVAPVLSIGASVAKAVGAKSDKENAEQAKQDSADLKVRNVRKYINDKKDKIQAEYDALAEGNALGEDEKALLNDDRGNALPLSDKMKEKIVLARLGAEVDLGNDDEPGAAAFEEAFKTINLKRARYIMTAPDKADMLEALGLDADAGIEDVAQALIGE
ncbi:MAG: hypothetical protein IJT87_04475 [Ruminiclostridium sp.]|nr:hypothetical protein [Ruminiclostridium sp.]